MYFTGASPQSSRSTSGDGPVIPGLEIVPPTSPTSSLDEPISTAVRRCRNSRTSHHGDPTKLTPQWTKRFKIYAKKLCEDNEVPTGEVMRFIDSGDMFYMLIDLKITLVKLYEVNKAKRLQELKDALESKDFEKNGLYNRLFACMLLPNITAYVTDTQLHIMDFITSHCDVFKIPPRNARGCRTQSSAGQISHKATYRYSVASSRPLCQAYKCRRCDQGACTQQGLAWKLILHIGTESRYFGVFCEFFSSASATTKVLPSKNYFPLTLFLSLKQDMRGKVECELGVNIERLENDLFDNNHTPGSNNQASPETSANDDHAPSARRNENGEDEELNGPGNNVDNAAVLQDDPLDSRFGLVEGTPARYNNTIRFWNFIDHSLLTMHQMSKESSSIPAQQDKELQKLFIEIFQADLAEFPGGKKLSKLISKTNPHWQTAIQTELIWNT
ncbi:uncharacterized protein EDB91DRAFT_1250471 [Suillus paluster]|uniref:uncharacterized protein n=1 Tax=Suillus paluster TaxID=48578 RepID=UPI001B87E9FB|nr:uncharacterized protein EDB91DRAFT_1250471 [Suillus paluster]KAG1735637.1 hypothetical protein EDB91DRAFT_1250471 [Suillus paluster]